MIVGLLLLMSTLPTIVAADPYIATATLSTKPQLTTGTVNNYILGTITFTQTPGENKVVLTGTLKVEDSFTNTTVGFHIHQTSNFLNGCATTGMHYNPENKTHGGPSDATRHVGDLGNVIVDQGTKTATVQITDSVITLVGRQSIIGRCLVIHFGTDDLGKGGNDESWKTGNAGGRYACGPIVLSSDFSPASAMSILSSGHMAVVSLAAIFTIAMFGLRW